MRRILLALAIGLALLTAAGQGGAAPGETAPGTAHEVTPEAGPYLICVASYTGEPAGRLAQELVEEIRGRNRIPAYVFNRGQDERKKEQERIAKIRQQQDEFLQKMGTTATGPTRIRTVRIEDQYAVLVGGYKDFDAASKALRDVKKWDAPSEKLMSVLTVVAPAGSQPKQGLHKHDMHDNPFAHAFVVRNPTVPHEQKAKGPDPFLKELNANEEYNLLKCGKPWTLAIKEYHSPSAIQVRGQDRSIMSKLFGKSGDALSASAMQAHELAKVLRELKFEAYVLHGRNSSVVTVGAFDRQDDPRMQQLQRQIANLKLQGSADPDNLKLFAQPLPMQVPQF